MGWQGHLQINYRHDGQRTVALDRHDGPLRVLQRLYPEGDAICHHVLVHPPGGLAGGDELDLQLQLGPGAHAVVTTPGATRFYRSAGEPAVQRTQLRLEAGSRLEWLPLETLAYRGCIAENHLELSVDDGAQAMGWDMLALGLPAAKEAFERGTYLQRLHWPGRWLERGTLDAADQALLQSPLGLANHTVLGTLWVASGHALHDSQRDELLDAARELSAHSELAATAGCSAAADGLVVLRVLAHRIEPLFTLLRSVRAAWRKTLWQLDANPPRIWRT